MSTNGQADKGPQYLFCTVNAVLVLPYEDIQAQLEANYTHQSKSNIQAGPVFRKLMEAFREWNKAAEPGMVFRSIPCKIFIVRLSRWLPIADVSVEKEPEPRLVTG